MLWRSRSPLSKSSSNEDPPPSDLLDRIEELRRRFVAARDFSAAFVHFDDEVASCPDLFPSSDGRRNAQLQAAIETCAQGVVPTFELSHHVMFEVRGTGFWHGIGHGRRDHVYFFYFASIRMGLVALCNPMDPQHTVHYMRFSLVEPVGLTVPSAVVRGSA